MGHFPGSSPTSLQTCRVPRDGPVGAPEVLAKSPTPSLAGCGPSPTRGAQGLGSNQPIFLFDNIPRCPVCFHCVRKGENFRIKAEKAHLFPMNPP